MLPKLSKPVNVVISGEDYTFPNNTDKRMAQINNRIQEFINLGKHKFINKLFVENLDEDIENALPIPLGINPRECTFYSDYFLKYENIDSGKPLKFTSFNRINDGKGQWEERNNVNDLCNSAWIQCFIKTGNTIKHDDFLINIGKYSFTICVHGGGLDVNPKLWEALLIGVIPIIRENKPYTDIYKRLDLPIVIVDKWDIDTITEDKLIIWHNKYYNYFTNYEKRKQMLYYLSLDYWINYVRNMDC